MPLSHSRARSQKRLRKAPDGHGLPARLEDRKLTLSSPELPTGAFTQRVPLDISPGRSDVCAWTRHYGAPEACPYRKPHSASKRPRIGRCSFAMIDFLRLLACALIRLLRSRARLEAEGSKGGDRDGGRTDGHVILRFVGLDDCLKS